MFLFYINNLSNVSNKLNFILFAEGTNVFCADKAIENVTQVLIEELKNIKLWFKANKLSLNVKLCDI